ncbi:hypothetical protein COHA_010459 [Chlorella ohadii]|uniref:MI domain-containing protein n=1 Tax=Chlorella ohadii TaxID=2649997 RepID=A0AAD5DCT6_9CHLO|nr:hypothetical protein COHA_010459 [Chlorella ohadii]
MFGGRGRGRGRGRGGGRSGPRLPHKLGKELFGDAAGGGRGRGRGQLPRKERRKAERETKRGGSGGGGGRGGGRGAFSGWRPAHQQQQQQRKGGGQQEGRPSKRQRTGGPAMTGIAAGSKFGELLPDHLKAAAGLDPEVVLQRDLARKLGLKRGKTKMGGEDGLDEFLDELGGIDNIFEAGSGARRAAAAAAGGGSAASEAAARVERRVRGLLNRLAEANIQGIVGDLAALYNEEGRRLVSDAVCAELIAAAAEGPRASDRFAAVTATAVAGLAGSVRTAEIVANFLDRLGARLEAAVAAGDGLACHNLTMVAAHLFLSGVLRPDVVHSMLDTWRERFTETDVSMIVTLLQACGLQLRAADPVAMKEFVVAVHARAGQAGGTGRLTKRAQILLELVVDVKNNRTREEAKRKVVVLAPAIGKWLKQCGAPDAAVGGISWHKVLQPGKKGIWWIPEATDAQPAQLGSGAALRAAAAAAAGGGEGGLSGPELLKLAAAMRMNTDARRAVFCVVMGSEDCVDAVEKLLRLGLKGEQEREIVRVTVDCCLQEKAWNPYYAHLLPCFLRTSQKAAGVFVPSTLHLQEKAWNPYYAHLLARLCGAGKGHKMTLQFCFWDQLKELDGMEVRRLTNLARLMASILAALALPATMLKAVDFAVAFSARETLFWRIFFEHLLAACKSAGESAAVFKRISAQPELKPLRVALAAFLRRSVGPWLAAKQPGAGGLSAEQLGELLRRLRGAERALASSAA